MNTVAALPSREAPSASFKDNLPISIGKVVTGRGTRFVGDTGHAVLKEHLVRIHPDNATTTDWVILLEAATIVGASPQKLRVAQTMREPRIVRKYNLFFKAEYFLVMEGYDPRIHSVYFCPQLYRHDADRKLVPLEGEEIGRLIADSVEDGVVERRPWYGPSDGLPDQPVIIAPARPEFDTLVVEQPPARKAGRSAT
jgi:hypothetical protein